MFGIFFWLLAYCPIYASGPTGIWCHLTLKLVNGSKKDELKETLLSLISDIVYHFFPAMSYNSWETRIVAMMSMIMSSLGCPCRVYTSYPAEGTEACGRYTWMTGPCVAYRPISPSRDWHVLLFLSDSRNRFQQMCLKVETRKKQSP